jgi:hypothetical protein
MVCTHNILGEIMKRRTGMTIAIVVTVIAAVLACGGIVVAIAGSSNTAGRSAVQLAEPASGGASTPKSSPKPKLGLTVKAIKLTVKTTEKVCFGSAGCNVQYEIRAAIATGTTPGDCDVTYEVRGLDDAQVGTLHVTPNGRYTQDAYQAGQTPRASSRLTAVVTDIDCE